MSGYPIVGEEPCDSLVELPNECPYTPTEIEEYLNSCDYHYSLSQPVAEFKVEKEHGTESEVDGRHYWVWKARNSLGENWIILVGSGRSPFEPTTFMQRWMCANDYVMTAEEYLNYQIGEQNKHDRYMLKCKETNVLFNLPIKAPPGAPQDQS